MESREVLIDTLNDLQEAAVPEGLQVIAFSKVFDLRAGGSGRASFANPQMGSRGTGPGDDLSDPLSAVAQRIGAQRETVAEVLEPTDDGVELIIPSGKLASGTASGAKEIALLIVGARQAAGLEEWTSWDPIRDACAEFKKLDTGNFAKTIRSMENVFNFRNESERKVLVKMAKPGWDEFATAVKRFGGES